MKLKEIPLNWGFIIFASTTVLVLGEINATMDSIPTMTVLQSFVLILAMCIGALAGHRPLSVKVMMYHRMHRMTREAPFWIAFLAGVLGAIVWVVVLLLSGVIAILAVIAGVLLGICLSITTFLNEIRWRS